MKKYSRQREAILNVLHSTHTHPTANWVYNKVREIIPNISLGTVYRNLALLTESGDILSFHAGDGFEHFDGYISPHLHLHCKCCGSITDASLENDFISEVARNNEFLPETPVYIVYGICKNCNKLKN